MVQTEFTLSLLGVAFNIFMRNATLFPFFQQHSAEFERFALFEVGTSLSRCITGRPIFVRINCPLQRQKLRFTAHLHY